MRERDWEKWGEKWISSLGFERVNKGYGWLGWGQKWRGEIDSLIAIGLKVKMNKPNNH